MTRISYLQASPRGHRSQSIALADAFLQAYRNAHPDDEIVTQNLFEMDLPPFEALAVNAKYTVLHGDHPSGDELGIWRRVEKVINDFKSFDKHIWAVPMWNFSIPHRLKLYIDILVQPGYTFRITDQGYQGLVTGKPIFIACARGGAYADPQSAALDMQKSYLQLILGFIGFTDFHFALVEPTLKDPQTTAEKLQQAISLASQLAPRF